MKVIELCGKGHCPVVKIADDHVEIGEKDNVCVLSMSEWEVLSRKFSIKKSKTERMAGTGVKQPRFQRETLKKEVTDMGWLSKLFGSGAQKGESPDEAICHERN